MILSAAVDRAVTLPSGGLSEVGKEICLTTGGERLRKPHTQGNRPLHRFVKQTPRAVPRLLVLTSCCRRDM